jgi:hypothetical protein
MKFKTTMMTLTKRYIPSDLLKKDAPMLFYTLLTTKYRKRLSKTLTHIVDFLNYSHISLESF